MYDFFHVDISGTPGIGKTLCVKEIMKKIQDKETSIGHSSRSKFIYLNAMTIKYQMDIFKALYANLTGKRVDSKAALYHLDDFFRKGKGIDSLLYVKK